MMANIHPSSSELLAALHEPDRSGPMLEHLEECIACRVRLWRIHRASGAPRASADSLQHIVEASTPLPETLADLVSGGRDGEPQPNEIWRVGQSEALLVWVRRVFDDGVADVIPLVLDADLADQESVVVGGDATPFATEIAVMVSLRTHVHTGAFLNRVGTLDIGKDVAEVVTAAREGRRPSGVRVGPPIDDDDDQRLEYRQALRDFLAEISPSAWLNTQIDAQDSTEQTASESKTSRPTDEIDVIKADLGIRLQGVRCRDVKPHTVTVSSAVRATSVMKVVYLDTSVLVATLHGDGLAAFPETEPVAAACREMTLVELDADAVVMTIPGGDWKAMLFTAANMRGAVELPGGNRMGPTATLEGYGLVDTLCKHLEGAMPAWEVTEQVSSVGRTDLQQIAARHASMSIGQVVTEGRRAHQIAKKTAWGSLPEELDEQVARFIIAVVNKVAVAEALAEFTLEARDD